MFFRTLQIFKKELSHDSKVLRHALRSAFAVAAAIYVSRYLDLEHGIWLPITVMIIMRPSLGGTIRFGWKRGLGTVIGAGVGLGLLFAFREYASFIMALFIFPAIFMMVFLRAFNYTVYTAFLTATVVLFLGIITPMGWKLGVERILDTVMGITIGVGTSLFIWPYKARSNLRKVMSSTIGSMEEHFVLLSGICKSGETREGEVISSRVRIVDNLNKCEESFLEASSEPGINAGQRQELSRLFRTFYRIKDLLTSMFSIINRAGNKPPAYLAEGLDKLLTDTGRMFTWFDAYIRCPEKCGEKPSFEESMQEFIDLVRIQKPLARKEKNYMEQSRYIFALAQSVQSIAQELSMAQLRLAALRNGRKN